MTPGGVSDVGQARPWLLVISNMRIKVVVVSFTTLAARDLLRLRNHKTCPETPDSSSSIFKHFGSTKQIKQQHIFGLSVYSSYHIWPCRNDPTFQKPPFPLTTISWSCLSSYVIFSFFWPPGLGSYVVILVVVTRTLLTYLYLLGPMSPSGRRT